MEPRELEGLLNKVGGKYKLVTLYQKRMRELQRGMARLTVIDSSNLWDIVSKEIMEAKVDLVMGDEADQMRKEIAHREAEENEKHDKAEKADRAEKSLKDKAEKADRVAKAEKAVVLEAEVK